MTLPTIRGFVMAGGRSTRMGRDKALIPYRGSTLLGHAIDIVRAVTKDVEILCGPTPRYENFGVPIVIDEICGAGPIAGLHAALVSASADEVERILWLAVDTPLVPPTALRDLIAGLDGADVAMARADRGVEPLCAAFRVDPCLIAARTAILEGRLKLTDALNGLAIREISADGGFFANVNTPDEFERLSRP
jgi:molybdenum cofactor guanylyltransferase